MKNKSIWLSMLMLAVIFFANTAGFTVNKSEQERTKNKAGLTDSLQNISNQKA